MKKSISVGLLLLSPLLASAQLETVDLATAKSGHFSVSKNAEHLVFATLDSLIAEDVDSSTDLYLKNLQTGELALVTKNADDSQIDILVDDIHYPSVSDDGRFILFSTTFSLNPNDVTSRDIYLKDMQTGSIEWVSESRKGNNQGSASSSKAYMSKDGRFIAFNANGRVGVNPNLGTTTTYPYVIDRVLNSFTRIPKPGAGNNRLWGIADNGEYIGIKHNALGNEDLYLYNLQNSTEELISKNIDGTSANWQALFTELSANGKFVIFTSPSASLVDNDNNNIHDNFMFNIDTKVITRLSTKSDGSEFTNFGISFEPAVTYDGNKVYLVIKPSVIDSAQSQVPQLYVKNLTDNSLTLISLNTSGAPADSSINLPAITSKEDVVYFMSNATNLEPSNGTQSNIYVTKSTDPVECEILETELNLLCEAINTLTLNKNGEIRKRFFNKKGDIKKKFASILEPNNATSSLCATYLAP